MKALTAMTFGAAMIGLAGLVYDGATAGQPMACPDREASIYFEHGAARLSESSNTVIDRIAAEAKACGAVQVIARTDTDARAQTLSRAFEARGLRLVVVEPPSVAPSADDGFIAGRVAKVGLTLNREVS
jgi:hypothetical protein